MYHLLVSYTGWKSGNSLPLSRVFEYTDTQLEKIFKPEGKLDRSKIYQIPAIFATETGGDGIQLARVGNINKIQVARNDVKIGYSIDQEISPIPNDLLSKLSLELEIGDYELSRTHWAIKNVNLFHVLLRKQPFSVSVPKGLNPKVFRLDEAVVMDEDLISVMMPFSKEFDEIHQLLQQIADEMWLKCLRADDIWENDAIIQDVVSLIQRSRIVICDCTGKNANVFYEAGIAHTLGKDVILITQSKDDVPFDLRHLRFIPYLNNSEGRKELSKKLEKRIRTIKNSR